MTDDIYLEDYGVEPKNDWANCSIDETANVQKAFNASGTTGRRVIFTGWVKINDSVKLPDRAYAESGGGRAHGGLFIDDTFDIAGNKYVLQLGDYGTQSPGQASNGTGATLGEFGIVFKQPENASRAELLQYPKAVNIGDEDEPSTPWNDSGNARASIKALRIQNAWDGLIGIGNCGGFRAQELEISAYNRCVHIDGAQDFVHIDSIHIWPFGVAGINSDGTYSGHASIFFDGQTVGLKLGKVDNFVCDKLSLFQIKSEIDVSVGTDNDSNNHMLASQFGSIGLDGDGATLKLGKGSTQIGNIYSTKKATWDSGHTLHDIECVDGFHAIGRLQVQSPAHTMVSVAGTGNLCIDDYFGEMLDAQARMAATEGTGRLVINTLRPKTRGGNRQFPAVAMQPGSSMHIGSVAPVDSNWPGSQPYIRFNGDNALNYAFCPQYSVGYNTSWSQGYYNAASAV